MFQIIEMNVSVSKNFLVDVEGFLRECLKDGLAHSYDTVGKQWVKPYPEVTGYLISYFSNKDYSGPSILKTVSESAAKLISLQNQNGGYGSFFNQNFLYTFDTAQITKGMIDLYEKTGDHKLLDSAIKGADFICSQQIDGGAVFPLFNLINSAKYVNNSGGWGETFSPIQIKCVESLISLHKVVGNDEYLNVTNKILNWGRNAIQLEFTHPYAYYLEGYLYAGDIDFVRDKLVKNVINRIESDGYISYQPSLGYSYTSGSIQIAILLYKTGLIEYSESILQWAREVIRKNNGLVQYANKDGTANYEIHGEINSWGAKYYCELERLFMD